MVMIGSVAGSKRGIISTSQQPALPNRLAGSTTGGNSAESGESES